MMKLQVPALQIVVGVILFSNASTIYAELSDETLAKQVTIYRDAWGAPHILGKTDAATCFGMGYAQAEDYFWQLEDNCIRALGRSAEVRGEEALREDLLNRSFEITRRSQEDFKKLSSYYQNVIAAFTRGINFFLETHPKVEPRLVTKFEPWHVLAMDRHLLLYFLYGRSHVGRPSPDSFESKVQAATGSNEWAIGPSKTRDNAAMLFINPHQPWYGHGIFYEAHMCSEEGLNFSGACFYGNPIPTLGFNEYLGWAYTVNDPDIADSFRVVFDDPDKPLNYRYGKGHRTATEWDDSIRVRTKGRLVERQFTFRKTHHGPIVKFENPQTAIAVKIAQLFSLERVDQALEMVRATNLSEWKAAVARRGIPMFNIAYADRDGNILYLYNGAIPIRNPRFDWTKTVDGGDPRTEWQGLFDIDDLPQVLNPPSAYVQNCNSSPFTTTDEGNPFRKDFPSYILEDAIADKRRAKISRKLLRDSHDLTFEKFQEMAFDTTVYWAHVELPRFKQDFARLQQIDPAKASKVKPLLDELLAWDGRAERESQAASLCIYWYLELYGEGYPAETLRQQYRTSRISRFDALLAAAEKLKKLHGTHHVKWGDIHRIQRVTNKSTVLSAGTTFNDLFPSLPCAGGPGPLGIIFTCYSSPSIPWVRPKRYIVVGASYLATVQFGKRVQAASVIPYGQSAKRGSPHFNDQGKLMSDKKLKTAWYYPEDVIANCDIKYHPGDN